MSTDTKLPPPPHASARWDWLGFILGSGAVLAVLTLPLAEYRADRISDGELLYFGDFAAHFNPAAFASWVCSSASVSALMSVWCLTQQRFANLRRLGAVLALTTPLILILLSVVNLASADTTSRVSLGAGFWVALVCLLLAALDVAQTQIPRSVWRLCLVLWPILISVACIQLGLWEHLSLLREWRATEDLYTRALWEHIRLAVSTTSVAACIGMPLGFYLHAYARSANALKLGLHFLHTIPSLALFGLLMLPLSALAARFPFLAEWGVHGIGIAPAWLALLAYALLPMFSTILSGLDAIDPQVIAAARGMGLSQWQIFTQVKLPLCRLSMIGAFTVTLVQMMGLATIAALIGGGGLGTLIFNGIGQNAPDLVLLGTLSVVGLSLLVQACIPDSASSSGK
jgi:osmoprotectant transport system permease protein